VSVVAAPEPLTPHLSGRPACTSIKQAGVQNQAVQAFNVVDHGLQANRAETKSWPGRQPLSR
jgi:hypothetical protein